MGSIPTSVAKREEATWPAGERVSCWQCGTEHAPDFFCPACDAIQPLPEQADYFQVMGLPQRLQIDAQDLQRRYYDLHRRLHPDLFQTGPQQARVASLRNTATVNRAYSTLRDPVDRGLYWLAVQGESLGTNNNRVPPDLAEVVFETQEKIEELRTSAGTERSALVADLGRARAELEGRRAFLMEALLVNFERWDAGKTDRATLRAELKAILSALSYLGTLIRDVERELET